jgi:hypothetical protein
MNDENDDFWITYLSATPDQDKYYSPMGCGMLVLIIVAVLSVLAWLGSH